MSCLKRQLAANIGRPTEILTSTAMTDGPVLLHHFFERAAGRWPDRIAVDIPQGNGRPHRRVVTYAQLAGQAYALARTLSRFVHGECVVAILLPRDSERLFSAQLAVLAAGAAYTCIDPAFPDMRIREILDDSAAVALLTDGPGFHRTREDGIAAVPVLDVTALDGPVDPLPPPAWLGPESLAYTIYTSGTTGHADHRGPCHRELHAAIAHL